MSDPLDNLNLYQQSMQLYDACWNNCDVLAKDFRGGEIAKQLIRSCGSISANIEEGYGRGYGKEYPQFLRISRGSARETKGWYQRSSKLLASDLISDRTAKPNGIIAMLSRSINTLMSKKK